MNLGNEATGNRAWEGYLYNLEIANKAIAKEEVAIAFAQNKLLPNNHPALIANYDFASDNRFVDTMGNAPPLSWQGERKTIRYNQGIYLSSNQWLKTLQPASLITDHIRRNSQFTFSTKFKTKYTYQGGLTRIISLSQDIYKRNFTLSQDKSNLVLRMRTPMSGNNGTNPQLVIPNFFADGKNHHLIITYNGSIIKFYIDKISNIYIFNFIPGFAIFNCLAFLGSGWDLYLNSFSQLIYDGVYYSFTFMFWGILVGLIANILPQDKSLYFPLVIALVVLPPIILELLLSHQISTCWRWKNAVFCITIAYISMMLFKLQLRLNNHKSS